MKNIHVLPTDKPSRLFKLAGDLYLEHELCYDPKRNQNIYITNDEEIKEGDWVLKCKNVNDWNFKSGELEEKDYSYFSVKCVSLALINLEDKKIILTTDQDLIKEGVQSIDDEFLEWFVKNPSCEWVEVEDVYKKFLNGDKRSVSDFRNKYKIIIQKEEPKQETLEEVAETIYPTYGVKSKDIVLIKEQDAFINGAKWQQEKIYNEIKELHDSEDITRFSQWTLAKCLDIIKNK